MIIDNGDGTYTSTFKAGFFVADELSKLSTSEGRAARWSEKDQETASRILGGAVATLPGLPPAEKMVLSFLFGKLFKAAFGWVPKPAANALVLLLFNFLPFVPLVFHEQAMSFIKTNNAQMQAWFVNVSALFQ